MKKFFNFTVVKEKGFAMLFAVLVSSVLLSVGISIFNLTIKELVLSSSGRESQFAFYAADTGIECAIYWDFKSLNPLTMYATSTGSGTGDTGWRASSIDLDNPMCVGMDMKPDFKNPIELYPLSARTRFELTIPNMNAQNVSAPYCAIVTITKSTPSAVLETIIESRGYNTACNSTSQNRIERALRVTY